MNTQVVASIVGASLAITGTASVGFFQSSSENREVVARLTMAVEQISGQLTVLHKDMKEDRLRIEQRLIDHGERITGLEHRTR